MNKREWMLQACAAWLGGTRPANRNGLAGIVVDLSDMYDAIVAATPEPELSPDGYYYRFDPSLPPGQRLWRRSKPTEPWGQGLPTFSVQHMSAAELRFVAALIDEARHVGTNP